MALKELGVERVSCLISTDDEAYTYNSRINRLSTIQDADCIYVLDQGRIIESGTHDQLLALEGTYQKMYQLQAGQLQQS